MLDKEKSRELRAAIRKVLMLQCDPIGVSEVPEAATEYDSYVGEVYDLLMGRAAGQKIAEYLRNIETK